ncbi:MAG: hypothetical protein GVY26_12420 [Bacteroidetes bacterium]|jgi:hypothetical protein|nr:hypothetical protein [Bacteroidota bacterium]
MFHGNSKRNPKPHHLYEIIDSIDEDVVKYGISAEDINEEGYSNRMRKQVDFVNTFIGWARFFARIILRNIPGRDQAEIIENEYIEAYKEKHGKRPRGNRK